MVKMGKKPPTLHLKASINNDLFVLGTLSYNLKKNEASFYFHCSNSSSKTQLDLDSGIRKDRIDHITWHEHVVQIRSKTEILHQIPYKHGKLFPSQKTIHPMYVESFFLNGDTSILCEDSSLDWKSNSDEILILDQKSPENFSLIFLLTPSEWITTDAILGSRIQFENGNEIPLFYLRTSVHELGRVKPFEGWDMLVLITPYTRDLPAIDARLGKTYRVPDYVSPVDSLTSILLQAKNKPLLEEGVIKDLYTLRDGP